MNSGQVGDSPDIGNMSINDGHQQDLKNGTAAYMGPGDGPVKGQSLHHDKILLYFTIKWENGKTENYFFLHKDP